MKKIKKHRTLKNRLYPDIRKSPPAFSILHRIHMSQSLTGKKWSEDTKKRNKGKIGTYKKTNEHKKHISDTLTGMPRPWQLGSSNPNWKGGKSPIILAIKSRVEYSQWRNSIFRRDNYTCQHCKEKKHELHPHHIVSFRDLFKVHNITSIEKAMKCKQLFDINNGLTLCRECHKLTDSFGFHHKKNVKHSKYGK